MQIRRIKKALATLGAERKVLTIATRISRSEEYIQDFLGRETLLEI